MFSINIKNFQHHFSYLKKICDSYIFLILAIRKIFTWKSSRKYRKENENHSLFQSFIIRYFIVNTCTKNREIQKS